MSQIEIEIDGKKIKTDSGKMLIEVADENNIHIPRFCYHKKLSIAANCRMCLVEVEKAPKTLPACATPINDGMKVFTQSKKTLESQHAVMEFLLVNHPLDCPICDQGGQCELQDLAVGYGNDTSEFTEGKRVVKDENLGPFIATEMTRCICCTRCVRFGQEVAGIREMGATGRGEHTKIGTYVKQAVTHEMSGNIIDLCPVGALTSKPFEFKARAWELDQMASVAAHDCVGSNTYFHTRRNEIMRVIPRDAESVNEMWLSDRDRFSYEAINSKNRLSAPMIKENGRWKKVVWSVALNYVADALEKVKAAHGAENLGAIISPNASCEEMSLLQKLMSGLGSHNIDHRCRQFDFSNQENDALMPGSTISINEIESQNAILVIGSHLRHEQPILAHRVRMASLKQAKVMTVNMVDFDMNCKVLQKIISKPSQVITHLLNILKAIKEAGAEVQCNSGTTALLTKANPDASAKAIAKILMSADKALVMLGAMAQNHKSAASVIYLANLIAKASHCEMALLTEGANSAGAYVTGCVPHRLPGFEENYKPGLHVQAMFKKHLKAYVLHGVDPENDFNDATLAMRGLRDADFVVALNSFDNESIRECANVILPMATIGETSGTYINMQGDWQSFMGAVTPHEQARPAWKIYRVLGNLLNMDGFDYQSSEEVLNEIKVFKGKGSAKLKVAENFEPQVEEASDIERVAEVPLYAGDSVQRNAKPLQEMSNILKSTALRLNSNTAKKYNVFEAKTITVKQDGISQTFDLEIDDRVLEDTAHIATATPAAASLGAMHGSIEIEGGK